MEKKLADQAVKGSMEAFCELYGMYKDRLYRYALYRLGNPEDAEDAVSECVLASWQSIGSLRNAEAFGSWIFRILSNCCARHIRKTIEAREGLSLAARETEDIQAASYSSKGSPSAAIELAEALSVLSEEERDIVLLSVIGGFTSKEISAMTRLTSGAVRSKLSRSLALLREALLVNVTETET